jgi:hypothetical protein
MRIHGKQAVPGLALAMAVPLIPCLAYLAAGYAPPVAPYCAPAACRAIPPRLHTGNPAHTAGSRSRPQAGEPGHPARARTARPGSLFPAPRYPPGLTSIYRGPAPGNIPGKGISFRKPGGITRICRCRIMQSAGSDARAPGRETGKEIGPQSATSSIFRNRAPRLAPPGSDLNESTLSALSPLRAAVRPAGRCRPPSRQNRRWH